MADILQVETTDKSKSISLEFNKFAKQTKGSVMVTCGSTQVLAVVTAADKPKEGQDFFPLTVDYVEKFYAAGRIPGNYFKREGMLSTNETLISRVIDRSIRPCFPDNYRAETFVTCTVVSVDPLHHPAPLALLGTSVALMISDIPFAGPVAGLRLGLDESGQFLLDPSANSASRLDLTIAASPTSVSMIEASADFLSEEKILEAIAFATDAMKPLFEIQLTAQEKFGVPKRVLVEETKAVSPQLAALSSAISADISKALGAPHKRDRAKALKAVQEDLVSRFQSEMPGGNAKEAVAAFDEEKSSNLRTRILGTGSRMDGRTNDEVRQIFCEAGVLRRTHGSALFQRGETQALATVTLGVGADEQKVDSVSLGDSSKSFMLHYNFPPYSVGEARPLRSPGRREIGHGALAERALLRAVPDASHFNYTVRVVSEILEADGSSSMASVCAGSMALLEAGVPLKEMIAGIAMGLVTDSKKQVVLSDINDEEDHLGDMDFKVCGGRSGITAMQMDNKLGGLSLEILAAALKQAKQGRWHILDQMTKEISSPRDLKISAPRVMTLKIRPDKIRELIGPGGKMIRSIQEKCAVRVTVEDNGTVTIAALEGTAALAAEEMVKAAITDPKPGDIFTGTVQRILDFGAFIEIKPGTDGLCHISELAHHRVERVEDVVQEGDEVRVKVLEVDRQGKIRLSRKELLER